MKAKQVIRKIKKAPLWLKVSGGAVIILLIAFLVLGFTYHPKQKPEERKASFGETETRNSQKVFSCTGIIKKIRADKIIFIAKKTVNPSLKEDSAITALISEKTKYYKVTTPKISPKEAKKGQSRSLFQRSKISISDLAPGDKITVISTINIAGKTVIPAERIQLIE